MDFGGFNSAENTPPSPSFSPALDISSFCRILVRNLFAAVQCHFPEILFRRNMRMGRDSFRDLLLCSERENWREVMRSRSLRNPYVANFFHFFLTPFRISGYFP